jgi:hypothetical protein
VALTYEQVQQYDLPPGPTKEKAQGRDDYVAEFGDRCWELDAIEPSELQRIVREAVEQHIDFDAWNRTLAEEKAERKVLTERFQNAKIDV